MAVNELNNPCKMFKTKQSPIPVGKIAKKY